MFDSDSMAGKGVGELSSEKRFRYALIGVCWYAKLEAANEKWVSYVVDWGAYLTFFG